jgi:predicted transglutaminase-like cysteine proteinase
MITRNRYFYRTAAHHDDATAGSSMNRVFLSLFLLCVIGSVQAWEIKPLNEQLYANIGKEYGSEVEQRFRELHDFMMREERRPIQSELAEVNDFFNRVRWRDDQSHWGKKDYWQTPFETLISFTGDCEDIAIAKYTTLRMIGVPDDKLAIVYVKITRDRQYHAAPHMVLAYYDKHDAEPLILDSIDKKLKTDSLRPDLDSVYEFNTTTLWLTDHHLHKLGRGLSSSHIALENELKVRLTNNRKHLMKLNGGAPFFPFELDTI